MVAAQTQLANFELNAYSAQLALTRAENNLKTLILPDRSSAFVVERPHPPRSHAHRSVYPRSVIPLIDAVNEVLVDRPGNRADQDLR